MQAKSAFYHTLSFLETKETMFSYKHFVYVIKKKEQKRYDKNDQCNHSEFAFVVKIIVRFFSVVNIHDAYLQ